MRRCRNDFTAVKITTLGAIANERKSRDQTSAKLSNQACCPTAELSIGHYSIRELDQNHKHGGPFIQHGRENSLSSATSLENDSSSTPLKVSTDREVYRPGDLIIATVEVHNGKCLVDNALSELGLDVRDAIQIERLIVEVKGIEKLDTQWVVTQKPSPGAKQRRGERAIFDSTPTSVISNMTLGPECTKTYLIHVALPKVLPPSFRGTVACYLYYLVVILHRRRVNFKNGHSLS
jgi:hypothetical protein